MYELCVVRIPETVRVSLKRLYVLCVLRVKLYVLLAFVCGVPAERGASTGGAAGASPSAVGETASAAAGEPITRGAGGATAGTDPPGAGATS